MNATLRLLEEGQSIWYDNIHRQLLESGEMARMIAEGEIRGVTSNPTIFMNAITRSNDYDAELLTLARAGLTAQEIYFRLTIRDIQTAADLFLPLYRETSGADGYVSLEVSPYLANETTGTIEEARRLWQSVDRPNLMVKIPATKAGLPAISQAIAEGINVNVTLIFARKRYLEVMDAYMTGLEKRLASNQPIDELASVASFFISRIDTKVDALLQRIIHDRPSQAGAAIQHLGKAAIANACLAYADFQDVIHSGRFQSLKAQGARFQRPLWASTSTKNPSYRDVVYVEELIGLHTVNTVPPQTLAAFLDHGRVRQGSLGVNLPTAKITMDGLAKLGVSMALVTQELEDEGVAAFGDAFTELLNGIETRRRSVT